MKTNVTLASNSRELFGVIIRQETKTGHLNLTDLQNAYSAAREQYGWSDKRVSDILSSHANAERLYYTLLKQGFIKTGIAAFMDEVKKSGLVKVLKAAGCYATRGKGAGRTTTCNPYVWVLVAMELNPMIYAEVVTWLTDRLIVNRIESGDNYRDLSRAVSKLQKVDYPALARAMNHIVFGRHETEIRNTGTEAQLNELHRLESNLAFMVDAGFVKTFDDLMESVRDVWRKKYNN